MKKLSLIASVAFAAFAATPAKADVTIVRWNSGMCQIWDNAAPPPWQPSEFILVARGLPDWAAAGATMNDLYASGKCGWAAAAQPVLVAPPPPTPVLAPPPAPEPWIPPPPPWAVTR